jgi:hypothetical protein
MRALRICRRCRKRLAKSCVCDAMAASQLRGRLIPMADARKRRDERSRADETAPGRGCTTALSGCSGRCARDHLCVSAGLRWREGAGGLCRLGSANCASEGQVKRIRRRSLAQWLSGGNGLSKSMDGPSLTGTIFDMWTDGLSGEVQKLNARLRFGHPQAPCPGRTPASAWLPPPVAPSKLERRRASGPRWPAWLASESAAGRANDAGRSH